MTAARETSAFEQRPVGVCRRITALVRIAIAVCLLPALVYLCLQAYHARLKGMPVESWRLLPLIVAAAACALLGKRFLNSVAGIFLGGIGGAFGILDNLAGPYGVMVGLVTGAIVVAVPILDKPRAKVRHVAATSTDREHTVRDGL